MPARGWCHGQEGRYYLAVRYVERVMVGYRQLGDHNGEGNCWARLGEFHHQLGQYQQAVICHRRAVMLCRQLGNRAE